ncbi:MAG: hypothetical protein JSU82_06380 [Rhodospirillales bacterium]|nr:MAG: hypothetical protein JSU82_06380 [Rhodospirillales bacterium]
MTGIPLLLAGLGGVVIAAGLALLVRTLVAVHRRTRSANLEHGILPGMVIAAGLGLVDHGFGGPGWPLPVYLVVGFGLAAAFAVLIVVVGRR